MEFSIKTIGSMWHAEDSVELVPTYYYMERDGSSLRQVNLYRKRRFTGILSSGEPEGRRPDNHGRRNADVAWKLSDPGRCLHRQCRGGSC